MLSTHNGQEKGLRLFYLQILETGVAKLKHLFERWPESLNMQILY